jgi:uncharacterized protein (TIRG00374 family)
VRLGAQFVFAAALLALLLWRVNVAQVRDELSGANLWWLVPAFVFNLVSDYFRALRWREFFRPMRAVGVRFLWLVALVGVACNLALPLRAGEFLRLQLLRRRTGLAAPQVIATILSEKLMDTVAFSAFLVLGIVLFDEAHFLWPLAVLYVGVLTVGVFGARWLAARSTNDEVLEPQPDGRWRLWIARNARSFGLGLQSFRSTRALGVISVTSVAAWATESVLYYSCGRALGLDLDPAVYLLVVVAATVAVSVPLTQAGIGVFEVALTGLLVAFGVDKSEAAGFAIFSHVMLAVPYFVAGPLAAIVLRVNVNDVLLWRSNRVGGER